MQQGEQNVKGVCLTVDPDPYGISMFAINSQVTKQKYTYGLRKFFDFINLEGQNIEERCRNEVEMDPGNGNSPNNNSNHRRIIM